MGKLMKVKRVKVETTKARAVESTAGAQAGKTHPRVGTEIAKVKAGAKVEIAKVKAGMESEVRAEKAKESVGESTGFKRSPCAVANTLELIGDKWSLLVVRDLLHGKRTYGELADSPEGIPTNILAERLKRLESAGIISSAAYQERPVRYAYTLTKKGTALGDVLIALVRWGKEYIPGTRTLRNGE
jgi:DNA-binding HxlR family transcriptional regulator